MRKLLIVVAAIALSTPIARGAGNVDAAFRAFWDAPTPSAAEHTIRAIADSGIDFDSAMTKLKAGRPYTKQKTGLIRQPASVGGESFETLIEIPDDYDPAKKWPLRVQLHGGVGRP